MLGPMGGARGGRQGGDSRERHSLFQNGDQGIQSGESGVCASSYKRATPRPFDSGWRPSSSISVSRRRRARCKVHAETRDRVRVHVASADLPATVPLGGSVHRAGEADARSTAAAGRDDVWCWAIDLARCRAPRVGKRSAGQRSASQLSETSVLSHHTESQAPQPGADAAWHAGQGPPQHADRGAPSDPLARVAADTIGHIVVQRTQRCVSRLTLGH